MSQSFSLSLHNPALTSPPDDIIYTGLSDGNGLHLVLTNNSGFDLTFAGGKDSNLLIQLSSSVLDAAGAGAITVDAPWATNGVVPPPGAEPAGAAPAFTLKLTPADAAGVPFPDGQSITIALKTIKPSATGTGAVVAGYQFPDINLQAASQVTVLGSGSTGKTLLGQYLQYTRQVNSGDELNPIVATLPTQPVTAENGAENSIHLGFFFLNPSDSGVRDTLGGLVPAWDPNHPPTFKLRFPYFDSQSPDPARADLTDEFRVGDKDYNAFTSAWNIRLSLDSSNPGVLENDWWKITPPASSAPSPYWMIQPKSTNTYLFTGAFTGPHASGPFLDLFFSHIYSNLPISPNNPHTQIILETYQFPGFNDALWPQPLNKVEGVEITSFGGTLEYSQSSGTVLSLGWQTRNADYCTVSGDATKLQPQQGPDGYRRQITAAQPLKSALTLTAYDKLGVSKISRTIYVRWKVDDDRLFTPSEFFQNPTAISLSPSASAVYLAGGISSLNNAVGLAVLNGQTLVTAPNPVLLPSPYSVRNVVPTPDNTKLLLAGLSQDGNSGQVFSYSTSTPPTLLKTSAQKFSATLLPSLYQLAVSDDSTQVVLAASEAFPPPPVLVALSIDSLGLNPGQGNPKTIAKLPGLGLAISGNKLFYPVGGSDGGLGVLTRNDLQPVAGSPVALRSDSQGVNFVAGPIVISRDGKTATTLAKGLDANYDPLFILGQVDVPSMKLTRWVQVYNGYSMLGPTMFANLLYSGDEKYLFVFGQDFTPATQGQPAASANAKALRSLVSVYDAKSLQELPWSQAKAPLASTQPDNFVAAMQMAPDGSRIYALMLDTSATAATGRVRSFVPYL